MQFVAKKAHNSRTFPASNADISRDDTAPGNLGGFRSTAKRQHPWVMTIRLTRGPFWAARNKPFIVVRHRGFIRCILSGTAQLAASDRLWGGTTRLERSGAAGPAKSCITEQETPI